jgi:hypothetical protein
MYPRIRIPSFVSTTAALLRSVLAAGGFVLAIGIAAIASAQDLLPSRPAQIADNPGHFEVRTASVELRDGVYFLNALIDYSLSSEARDALQSGVPLTIRLEVEIAHGRRFWFDNELANLQQLYQLEYHALSERFIVHNANSGDQESFATLFAALNYLGQIERLPLIDAALVDDSREYDVRLRAVLDVEQFPGPLRLLAFWRRDWSLASEWYRWPLQSD